jgi:hypothetical protein
MSGYDAVLETIDEYDLSWGEIDRIELHPETYQEFQERASDSVSDHATSGHPAVRKTTGQQKLVYVSENGAEVVVDL